MQRSYLALGLLAGYFASTSLGAAVEIGDMDVGVVVEITSDTIKLRGETATTSYKVSGELLTNTPDTNDPLYKFGFRSKFKDLKKGSKVQIWYIRRGGELVCYLIAIELPEQEQERQKEKKLEQEKGDFNFGKPGEKG